MGNARITAKLPALPAPEFFARAEHSIITRDGAAILTFDPSTRSGFIYQVATGAWLISSPVSFGEFALLVVGSGYAVDDSEDARRWLRACGAEGGSIPPHPPGGRRH
ncbi:hypothetical protein ACFQ2D_08370 [Luteimonas composti]|uniref:hypothetical protein n=1 Tax=Luteimonas composti TaxID=398257 RepID=UPI003644BC67